MCSHIFLNAGMEMDSLLDPVIDSSHRSYFAAVEHRALEVLRPRPPGEAISIHHDWCDRYVMKYYCLSLMYSSVFLYLDNFVYCRLREAGLLTLSRLVEVGPIQLDRSLLTVLVDRWRPETHTFHLPCGEMTPTLQDVAYLLGLPIVGEAVGPRVVAASWKDDLEARFALVDCVEEAGQISWLSLSLFSGSTFMYRGRNIMCWRPWFGGHEVIHVVIPVNTSLCCRWCNMTW